MKFLGTIFGLSLCAATVGATSFTAGTTISGDGYTYSGYSCVSQVAADCAAITAQVIIIPVVSQSGIAEVMLSDNGAVAANGDVVTFSWDLAFVGTGPYPFTSFSEEFNPDAGFLGGKVNSIVDSNVPGYNVLGVDYLPGLGPSGLLQDSITFTIAPPQGPASSGQLFVTDVAQIDTPEPSSFGLYALSLGFLLVGLLRRHCVKR